MDINERIKEVVSHIKNARDAAGFNQTQVAKALDRKQPSISNWENGQHLPNLKEIIIMLDLFSATPNMLLGGMGDSNAPPPTPQIIGPCLACYDGDTLQITQEEEAYLIKCLAKARDGQTNPNLLETKQGKKDVTA